MIKFSLEHVQWAHAMAWYNTRVQCERATNAQPVAAAAAGVAEADNRRGMYPLGYDQPVYNSARDRQVKFDDAALQLTHE